MNRTECLKVENVRRLGADLGIQGVDLHGLDLQGVDFRSAELRYANLRDSDLRGVDFRDADVRGADFHGAKVKGVKWPSPTMVLLANWGKLSDGLTADLMRLDASGYPNTKAFSDWAYTDGSCPYEGINVQRIANFRQQRELWKPGRPRKIYDLMCEVLNECCVTTMEGR